MGSVILNDCRESISRHVSVQMVDTLNTFCEQTHVNNLHVHVFLVSSFVLRTYTNLVLPLLIS